MPYVRDLKLRSNPNGGKLLLDSFFIIYPDWPPYLYLDQYALLWLNDHYLKTVRIEQLFNFQLQDLTPTFSLPDCGLRPKAAMEHYLQEFPEHIDPENPGAAKMVALVVTTVSEDINEFRNFQTREHEGRNRKADRVLA